MNLVQSPPQSTEWESSINSASRPQGLVPDAECSCNNINYNAQETTPTRPENHIIRDLDHEMHHLFHQVSPTSCVI